jgi:Transposase domain (DUF772)
MVRSLVRPAGDQPFLMSPDMRDWLPEDDLVWVVLDAWSSSPTWPRSRAHIARTGRPAGVRSGDVVALLLCGYCHGVRSSREIEHPCVRDLAFRVIAGGLRPDHATIARVGARHEAALQTLCTEILRLCAQAGLWG